ncbi:MAG TPA: ROK family protein [Ignavibacteriales bacterium]|nr:ROK family protein [Ignavibacteriales bacterium]
MKLENDTRIVMTLDAGGTNFVFSAIRSNKEIVSPVTLPSNGNDLGHCLSNIINGFSKVRESLPYAPSAISFAFPGPADYPMGIIGDLGNLPAFRGGIALGPMLEEQFKLPVFINNDGDLFVYGEAIAGFLPYVNSLLEEAGSPKRFSNLFGVTLGTGFGAGIVRNGELFTGDNSGAGEIWLLRNKINPSINAEEGASIRAVRRVYAESLHIAPEDAPEPREIYEIAEGKIPGNKGAAIHAFRQMAEVVGDALANALTLIDGLAVIGGGIAGAHKLFLPAIVEEMNSNYLLPSGNCFPRLAVKTFNLEDENELKAFLKGDKKEIKVPGSSRTVTYDPLRRLGVGISKMGTSKAVSVGAYAFALNQLDSGQKKS